jgi:hypothetical protein
LSEKNNLVDEHPEKVAEMRQQLHEWYKRVDAKFLSAKPDGPTPWHPGD